MPPAASRVSVPPPANPFDYFCFESTDASSVILNYVALKGVLQTQTIEQVVQQVAQYVQVHMAKRQTPTFTFHLFCNGMVIREMAQHRVFMLHFARLFKETFPQELTACYVYNAPSFFSSIYELLRPVLPKSSRDKIIMAKSGQRRSASPPSGEVMGGGGTSERIFAGATAAAATSPTEPGTTGRTTRSASSTSTVTVATASV